MDALPIKKGITGSIMFSLFCVLPAIKLDGESALVTVEIQNVRCDRVLTSKFVAAEGAVAQQVPEVLFGIRLV